MRDRATRVVQRHGLVPRVARLMLVSILSVLLGQGCSSLSSHYFIVPEPEDEWAEDPGNPDSVALYRGNGFEVRLEAPIFGGRWQHSMGPCLFPVIPIRKEWPGMNTELHVYIRTEAPARREIDAVDWPLLARIPTMEGMFGGMETRELRPMHLFNEEEVGLMHHYRLIYRESTSELDSFIVRGAVYIDGNRIDLPALEFDKKGKLYYDPYTTQFLEVL